jgi:hypothetical protein
MANRTCLAESVALVWLWAIIPVRTSNVFETENEEYCLTPLKTVCFKEELLYLK